jgi:hypothetical protein
MGNAMAKKKANLAQDVDPELMKAYGVYRKHAARLRKKKGVVAVSFGLKCTKGCYGFEQLPHLPKAKKVKLTHAILIYVKEKRREASLSKRELLPKEIDGVPTDIIEMPTGRCAVGTGFDTDFPTLMGGAPIGITTEFGTLGIVCTGAADGQERLLTCAHVAFGIPPTTSPGSVFQPPAGATVVIGTPDANGLDFGPPLDCASVKLNGTKPTAPGQISTVPGQIDGVIDRSPSITKIMVKKIGVKTGPTSGHIVDPSFPFHNDDLGIDFPKQYLLAPSNPALPFAAEGDSGALLYAQQSDGLKAVGIIIGLTSSGSAVACPIVPALEGLGLRL